MFCPVSILWGQDRIQQYAGTAMPYPIVKDSFVFFQDSMVPFYVNHLGRHGARFPTSGKALNRVKEILELAQRENRLTSGGVTLLSTIQNLSETFDGQWGKLSVVGEMDAEQLWDTTMDPEKRILLKVTMDEEDSSSIDLTFNTLMGDKVEPRREFIEANAKYVRNLDI